jgi:predicted transcriptional regulator
MMALIRVIRPLPIKPTREKLRRLMNEYGLTRAVAARLMRCSQPALGRYLRPESAAGAQPIPLGRWELLLMKVQAIYHPDEQIEMQL